MKGGEILTDTVAGCQWWQKKCTLLHPELSSTVNGRDKETDSHQSSAHNWLCWGRENTAALECTACLVFTTQYQFTSGTDGQWHPHIHTQTFTYHPPSPRLKQTSLSHNLHTMVSVYPTQWRDWLCVCVKQKGHKCRFGCASRKQNRERLFTFFNPLWNAWQTCIFYLHNHPCNFNLWSLFVIM